MIGLTFKYILKRIVSLTLYPFYRERTPLFGVRGKGYLVRKDDQLHLQILRIERGSLLYWFGCAYDDARQAVASTLCLGKAERVEESPIMNSLHILPPRSDENIDAVVCTSLHADRYYHWMLDVVPKLIFLRANPVSVECAYICRETAFQHETLAIMRLPFNSIKHPPASNFHTKFRTLYCVTPTHGNDEITMEKILALRSVFLTEVTAKSEVSVMLYVARGPAETRKVLNEENVESLFRENGFLIFRAEEHTVQQQAEWFRKARVIVGPHGAVFTNTIFCEPGTKVIEFMPTGYFHPGFSDIANILNFAFHRISVQASGESFESIITMSDIEAALRFSSDVPCPLSR